MPREFKRTNNLPNDPHLIFADKDNLSHFNAWVKIYQAKEVTPFVFLPYNTPRQKMHRAYKTYLANPRAFFFFYTDEKNDIVSTCRFTIYPDKRSHAAVINAVATNPNKHGKGYGSKMLLAAIEFIQQEYDPELIELSYEDDNDPAWALYEKKFGFQTVVTLENQWPREIEFIQKFSWLATVRCAVRYQHPNILEDRYKDIAKFDTPILLTPLSKEVLVNEHQYRIENFSNSPNYITQLLTQNDLFQEYTEAELNEIKSAFNSTPQTIYCLYNCHNKLVATLSLYSETVQRLEHIGTMPIFALSEGLGNSHATSFVCAALTDFREKHPQVYHYSAAAQFTSVAWYTTQQSHILKITQVLQAAGFAFSGIFKHHFNSDAPLGRDLLTYEFCWLGFNEAKQCIKLSSRLNETQKNSLKLAIEAIQNLKVKLSPREEYEAFRIVKLVACHHDFNTLEQKSLLRKYVNILEKSEVFKLYAESLDALLAKIDGIINSSEKQLSANVKVEQPNTSIQFFRSYLSRPHISEMENKKVEDTIKNFLI